MKRFESLVIVGSSGAGKTTLVNGLRTPEFADTVVIPRRYITRPERNGDDLGENSHVDKEWFEKCVLARLIKPYWERDLENGRKESYGFDVVDDEDPRLRVYSANNAFLRNPNPSAEKVLENGLVVVAMSGSASRSDRLSARSPDMGAEERAVRLEDEGTDMLSTGLTTETIDTSGLTPEEGQAAFRAIVDTALSSRQ